MVKTVYIVISSTEKRVIGVYDSKALAKTNCNADCYIERKVLRGK